MVSHREVKSCNQKRAEETLRHKRGYGRFPEAGVTMLCKRDTARAPDRSYAKDMHAYGEVMSLTDYIQVFPYHELKSTFFLSTKLLKFSGNFGMPGTGDGIQFIHPFHT